MVAYAVSFSAIPATGVDKDVFYVLASTTARLRLTSLFLAKTTAGSTEAMSVAVYRGSTLASGAGTTGVAVALDPRVTTAASFTANTNSTAPGSSGASAKLLFASGINDDRAIEWCPSYDSDGPDYRPVIGLGERLQVRMGASQAAASVSGTLVLEEIGKSL